MTTVVQEQETDLAAIRRRAGEVFALAEFALEIQRQNILRRNPQASEEEIEGGLAEFVQRRPGAPHGDASGPAFRRRPLDR